MLITIWFVAINCLCNNTVLAPLSLWLTMVNSLIHQNSKQQQCITDITGWLWRHFVPKRGVPSLPSPFFFPFLFLSFSFFFPPFSFSLPPLPFTFPLPSLSFSFPSLSFSFPFPSSQIQLEGLGSAVNDAYAGWSRHNAAAASHIVTSRQSVI